MANDNKPNPNRIKISPWIIYAGIVVLFLFVIMLLNLKSEEVKGIRFSAPEAGTLLLTLIGFFLGIKFEKEITDYLLYIIVGFIVITALPLFISYIKGAIGISKVEEEV